MKEKSDRTAYIKKALDSYGYEIYSVLYSHMRSGDTWCSPDGRKDFMKTGIVF